MAGVRNQIHKDLRELLCNAGDWRYPGTAVQFHARLDVRDRVLTERKRTFDFEVDVDRADLLGGRPRVADELASEPEHALRRLVNSPKALHVFSRQT